MKLHHTILAGLLAHLLAVQAQAACQKDDARSPFDARAACAAWQVMEELAWSAKRLPPLVQVPVLRQMPNPLRALRLAQARSPALFAFLYEWEFSSSRSLPASEAGFDPEAAYRAFQALAAIERPSQRPEPEIFAELYRGFLIEGQGAVEGFHPALAFEALLAMELVEQHSACVILVGSGRLFPGLVCLPASEERRSELFGRLYRLRIQRAAEAESSSLAWKG
jgi:hypothetical protein